MKPTLIIGTLLCALSGCATSLLEERVITDFVDALEEENVTAMRRVVSTDFERKALRSDDVLRDLDIVRLPKGEIEIINVEEPADDERSVIVSDASGEKYKFELVRDSAKQRWAVNDVLVRQQKKWKKVKSSVSWPTSQVLDLVFSVREYLDVWTASRRSEILAKSSPRLAASLEAVPESWLPVITNGIGANYDASLARKPEAQFSDGAAVVRMPVRGGFLLVSAVQVDDRWLMDDIEIHSRSDSGHPGSVRRQADSVASLCRFLQGFATGDRELLQAGSSARFYNATLQFADLSLVTLPSADTAPDELSIRAFSGRVTIIVPTEREFIRFDMLDPTHNAEKHVARSDAPRHFHVDNVILNDRTRRNERTLASVFTAPTRASLFFDALRDRDVTMLRQLSTREFNDDVWSRLTDKTFSRLTTPTSRMKGMKLNDSDVRGNRTQLTFVTTDGQQVQCRMIEQTGRLLVDDVQYRSEDDQILSLRVQSGLQIPIAQFTAAWRAADLDALKETVSTGFDRLVLTNFTGFPPDKMHLADRLDTALQSTRVTQERATVNMGLASSSTAEVHLVLEHDRWVIDDISIPGHQGDTVRLRQQLRQQIVDNMRNRTNPGHRLAEGPRFEQPDPAPAPDREARSVPVIHKVGGVNSSDDTDEGVVNAPFQVFGPNSSEVTRRLREPPSAEEVDPEITSPGTVDPASTVPLAPGNRQVPLKPVPVDVTKPAPTADMTDAEPEFLQFGPGISGAETRDKSAVSPTPISDLAANPVPID